MTGNFSEMRIFPISPSDYRTEEYAKMCITDGFEHYTSFCEMGNDRSYWNLYNSTLFLFQFKGQIIAKANVHLIRGWLGTDYYTDNIEILNDNITVDDVKCVWKEFKKFNSVAQIVPAKYETDLLELFDKKEKRGNIKMGENESFVLDELEGNKIRYYVTKYERNPKYRAQAIKIHGCICQTCGFDFGKMYGYLGEGYIEVHHIKPLYSLEEEMVPDPETDMICLCSNCHRMIHRHRTSIMSPEELIRQLDRQRRNEE